MSCNWPVNRECLPTYLADSDDAKRQHIAEDLAVNVLWALSGRQFGVCTVQYRPCPTGCAGRGEYFDSMIGVGIGGPGWFPIFEAGNWRNVMCGCLGSGCRYAAPSMIHLPGDAVEVTEVVFAGEVQDDSAYKLEGSILYRTGGLDWPSQDMTRPLDEPGTWSVTFTRGRPVPAGVATMVGTLALEFMNACSGGKCKLPRRVTSVTRQGVTYQMVDPTDIYATGKTGFPEIDLWLSAVNPHHLMQGPSVR